MPRHRRRQRSIGRRWLHRAALCAALAGGLVATRPATGATVVLTPSKDNTLIEDPNGAFSNGAGPELFVGRVDVIDGGTIRRAVLTFDVAAAVPAGSTVTAVSLTLSMSKTKVGLEPVSLHRLLADWGEGTSTSSGGGGAPSTPGDATWIHTFYSDRFWSSPGGDHAAAASATIQIGAIGQYTWLSTPSLVADVQSWVDRPVTNFGWVLIGDETTFPTSKRFDSRENPTASVRPMLTVTYNAGAAPAGRVPDGGAAAGLPLTVEHADGGDIRLSWGASCLAGDSDYEIYAGVMGDFANYAPRVCSTGGAATITLTPAPAGEFYLVVPRNATREGSYGFAGDGGERPPAAAGTCLPQSIAACP